DNVFRSKVVENPPAATRESGNTSPVTQGGLLPVAAANASAELLPNRCFSPGKLRSVSPKKRKVVLPMVDLGRMATVQEACQDSPTIPGRPALLERSMSVPAVVSLRRLSEEPNQSTPKASEFSRTQMEETTHVIFQTASLEPKLTKQSSFLMTRELTPLVIPTISPKEESQRWSGSSEGVGIYVALPPRVPPKSPRTESRASPRAQKPQRSAQGSVSTTYSSVSPASSSSSIAGRDSPRLLSGPHRSGSPLNRSSPRSGSVDNASPESLWSKLFRLDSISRRKKSMESVAQQRPRRPETPSAAATAPLTHRPYASEASAATRGRPTRKDSLAYLHPNNSNTRSPSSSRQDSDLPVGFKATEASRQVADVELRSLRQQADEQVCNFEVLQTKDVVMLSKELRQLDDRCQYLQNTYQSLRQGRKSLHERMMSYLRSPHMTNLSRESILKHEEALAEIDNSIDEWIRKSEQAENRRMRVRQKLLEHVAAALTLQPNGTAGSHNRPEEQTPPESPENDESFCTNGRRDVQSIKVYADTAVTALLAEIDREIGYMEYPEKQLNR
ncbi:MAG: hypothetical protein Q9184_005828, partial [Pyrenodesmia sp. 2 TL-2023]